MSGASPRRTRGSHRADVFQLSADLTTIAKNLASVEARMQLSQASIALGELASENRRLSDENAELRSRLARRKELEYRDGPYYLIRTNGDVEGPVCRRCYMSEGLINRLAWKRDHELRCTVCGTTYSYGELGEFDPPTGVAFL